MAFSSRFEVKSACERTFHNTGLYYFHLENYDADRADDDVISSVCVVKVTQTDRYIVKFVDWIITAAIWIRYLKSNAVSYLRQLLIVYIFTIGHQLQYVKCQNLVISTVQWPRWWSRPKNRGDYIFSQFYRAVSHSCHCSPFWCILL